MRPTEAARQMFEIEHHGQAWNSYEFLAWLLDFKNDEELEQVLQTETSRAYVLADQHYQRVSGKLLVYNPRMISEIAFLQGATFAAAALGRKPYPE